MARRCRTSGGESAPVQTRGWRRDPGRGALVAVPTADPDPLRYCRPQQFTGSSGGFTEAVEFLFTPGRVTITNEMGLIRRIYTDGRALPADPDVTNTGFSVGRWEGQTLVVETVGINPDALYPDTRSRRACRSAPMRASAERIFLKDPNTLAVRYRHGSAWTY